MDIDIPDPRSKSLMKDFKFFFKITYIEVPFDCLYFLNNDASNKAFIDDFFLIFMFYFLLGCYYLYLKIKKTPSLSIVHDFKILCYVILPIIIRKIADCLAFKQINGQYLLKTNTNFQMIDEMYEISLFFIPNSVILFIILVIQNLYLSKKKKQKNRWQYSTFGVDKLSGKWNIKSNNFALYVFNKHHWYHNRYKNSNNRFFFLLSYYLWINGSKISDFQISQNQLRLQIDLHFRLFDLAYHEHWIFSVMDLSTFNNGNDLVCFFPDIIGIIFLRKPENLWKGCWNYVIFKEFGKHALEKKFNIKIQ